MDSYEDLCDFTVLEGFQSSLAARLAASGNERKVRTASTGAGGAGGRGMVLVQYLHVPQCEAVEFICLINTNHFLFRYFQAIHCQLSMFTVLECSFSRHVFHLLASSSAVLQFSAVRCI